MVFICYKVNLSVSLTYIKILTDVDENTPTISNRNRIVQTASFTRNAMLIFIEPVKNVLY